MHGYYDLLMNMLLAPLAVAILESLAGGALLEVAVRPRLQPRPPTRRG
jgi:hypothetical protein